MTPIRVLVVDDSIVVRRLVTEVINADADLTVAGTARNGIEALKKVIDLDPDIITLDIEMPEMDGIETLRNLRDLRPKVPVVMFSTLTVRGSEATLDALTLGARDYVAKPANVGSVTAVVSELERELVPKLKALVAGPRSTGQQVPTITTRRQDETFGSRARPVRAVVLASSTGGPVALETVLFALTQPLSVPLFIVQHIPPVFSELLASRLDGHTVLNVVEASDGMLGQPGTAYIAPGDRHMRLERSDAGVSIRLGDDDRIQHCRPAADALFSSAVEIYGGDLLGVVLTGMGHDGLAGCRRICTAGGSILVQDEATSVVWGMPGAVAEAELANEVLSLNDVAPRIEAWLARHAAPAGVRVR